MECSDPRHSDVQRVRAALEQMDDESVTAMADMMEEVARKNPRPPRPNLKIVRKPLDK